MANIIDVKDLEYSYAEQKAPALQHVSFQVEQGSWVAVIGHNGSGKSTLAKNMLGLLEPAAGTIKISGMELSEETVWQIRARVGIVFQNPDSQFVGATVADDVAFGLENREVPRPEMLERVEAALKAVGMQEYANREPAHLSGGQKQRVAIAGVVAQQPDIIILDEATSMLDPAGRKEIIALIRELKAKLNLTVVSITHDLDEAALADQIIVLDSGKVVETGTPATIFARGSAMAKFGLDVPYSERVKEDLTAAGLPMPNTYMSEEGLVDYLWTLRSTM
ncbi:energy-coupling factor ABC transporter ATP-binding protein [Lacticaseibacillus zhaodongensis]|uniref:energy-coupling factor ABC transporter ATP-binding protein n=1 Tax=Lacticaseibacillus zhaodongensis TaxID=2668065 RepID=UPI0012D34BA0|nr:energy-coupling factor ABC transporter ATP-binding protein [Lacticaseibacillus zhaodongensis]